MNLSLTGVLEDGSPRGASVPNNPRRALNVPLGGDVSLALSMVKADGAPLTLAGGDVVLLTVKKKPSDQQAVFQKTGAHTSTGLATFTLVPTDTKQLTPGLYCYDVWVTFGGKRSPLVPVSPFQLEPAATLP